MKMICVVCVGHWCNCVVIRLCNCVVIRLVCVGHWCNCVVKWSKEYEESKKASMPF
jgi:hypothetical protein